MSIEKPNIITLIDTRDTNESSTNHITYYEVKMKNSNSKLTHENYE